MGVRMTTTGAFCLFIGVSKLAGVESFCGFGGIGVAVVKFGGGFLGVASRKFSFGRPSSF